MELSALARPKAEGAGEIITVHRKTQYPKVFPTGITKLGSPRKKGRHKPRAPKKPRVVKEKSQDGEPCGLGCLVFPCFQRFNSIGCFMVVYCILVVAQGIVFGLVDLSSSNFERNYKLSTFEWIALISSYDVSSCLVAILISYYGGKGDRKKWTAFSSFWVGFGSIILGLPHLRGENNKSKLEVEDICDMKKVIDTCPRSVSFFQSRYVSLFIIGQSIQGIAAMPLYILAVTFLYDSVSLHSSGIYLGFGGAALILGYACGVAMGAPLVKTAENTTFGRRISDGGDSQRLPWNWWSSFLFASLLAWSTLIPLLCFPRNIAGTAKEKTENHEQSYILDNLEDQEFGTSIKDLCAALWILMKNRVFIFLCLSKASESLVSIGASVFVPIYLEHQFVLTPNTANMIAGFILLPGGALGQLLGGVIASKLEMSCKALMRFVMVTSSVSIVTLVVLTFIHCDPVKFAGINEDYDGTGKLGDLRAPCNSHCKCSTALYHSVCGRDNVEYFSPCFAGCTTSKYLKKKKTYYNCSCIKEGLTNPDQEGDFIDAVPGKCDVNCYKLPLFIALLFSSIIFSWCAGIPGTLCIFRVVPEKLCSLALGVSYTVRRILGSIPGPLVFKITGGISCTFRDTEHCKGIGHCWMYDKTEMAFQFIGISFICKLFTIFFTAVAFYGYKNVTKESTETLILPVRNIQVQNQEKTDL
ncbi:solute carrier organic anion transporter family member 6A1 [Ochotona curzoniae]|uniref:solute carrier organic anion transporter family member 6A1 n=1 Tax=Ochotona curzoniae TaxID=130825 RepID=UPI001B3465FD|nr:solute carrier organic anion transporter family member 6A1 [Ochotona curzoniae]